jgi:hypothetical protein
MCLLAESIHRSSGFLRGFDEKCLYECELSVNFCALIESALIKITHAPLDYVRGKCACGACDLFDQAGGRAEPRLLCK